MLIHALCSVAGVDFQFSSVCVHVPSVPLCVIGRMHMVGRRVLFQVLVLGDRSPILILTSTIDTLEKYLCPNY